MYNSLAPLRYNLKVEVKNSYKEGKKYLQNNLQFVSSCDMNYKYTNENTISSKCNLKIYIIDLLLPCSWSKVDMHTNLLMEFCSSWWNGQRCLSLSGNICQGSADLERAELLDVRVAD